MDPITKRTKSATIVSVRQKWARLEKKYLYSDRTSDANILMAYGQGGDLSARKRI